MKKFIFTAITLSAASLSSIAAAQQPQFELGLSGGYNKGKIYSSNLNSYETKVEGLVNANEYFGAGFSLSREEFDTKSDSLQDKKYEFKTSYLHRYDLDLVARVSIPKSYFGGYISPYAKAGQTLYSKYSGKQKICCETFKINGKADGYTVALGTQAFVSDDIALTAEVQAGQKRFKDKKNNISAKETTKGFSLGVNYKF